LFKVAARYSPASKHMKTKSLIAVAGILALMGVSYAEEGAKKPKKDKVVAPEMLAKYDKNQDGKLSKEERAEMKKDKKKDPASKPKCDKKSKVISPEILAKYDKDQDGKLSKDERKEMKKDQPKKEK